jgi:anti-sigma regulatory factor (Ser/Thr protein kinase)
MTGQLHDLAIEAHPANLAMVRSFVASTLRDARLTPRERSLLVLAVDEALTSLLLDAQDRGAEGHCVVSVDVDDVRVRVCVDDRTGSGAEWRPARREMGLFLMRAVVDEIAFSARRGRSSRLELVKFTTQPEACA